MLKKAASGLKTVKRSTQLRSVGQMSARQKENFENRMQAWQIHSYGGLEELKLSCVRIPVISSPTDVLVKVDASSVNNIDIAVAEGYGASVLRLIRRAKNLTNCHYDNMELPLTLGRDFSGVVVSKGHRVGNRLNIGDEVWGVIPVEQQGCHADYVVVNNTLVNQRPPNLSHIEAASILYAGLTAWSALWLTGGLCYKTTIFGRRNKRVLVIGGSGGVGTLAVQLLKAWNMHVITTCGSDAVDILYKLGADVAIDYELPDADAKVIAEGPYEVILDCANQGPELIRKKGYPHLTYVTLNSPILRNIDQYGFIIGGVRNIRELVKYNIPIPDNKGSVKWGFFTASTIGINILQKFVENEQVVPVVTKVYPFKELPLAYARAMEGRMRGKFVINMR